MRYFFFLFFSFLLLSISVLANEVSVSVDRSLHSPGDVVVIKARPACNISLIHGNWSIQLPSKEEIKLNTSGFPLGDYKIVNRCENGTAEASFRLDELLINAYSPLPNTLKIDVLSRYMNKTVNATVTVNGSIYNGTFPLKPGLLRIHANLSGISADKDLYIPNISIKKYYAPWENVTIGVSSEEKPEITIITPLNASFSPNLSDKWIASFAIPQPVALGTYKLKVKINGIELVKEFIVTMDDIKIEGKQKGIKWLLNISAHDVLTGAPVNGTINIDGKLIPINGTVNYETDRTEVNICLIDSRGIEVKRTLHLDLVFSDKKLYLVNETVKIWSTGDVVVKGPETAALNKSKYNETFFISTYVPKKAGNYSLTSGNASYSFLVLSPVLNWSFDGSNLTVKTYADGLPVQGNLTVITCNKSMTVKFNGSISLKISAPALFKVEPINFTGLIPGVMLGDLYFPGDKVEICALGNVSVRSPSGRIILNKSIYKPEILDIQLNQTVELGNYTVKVDEEEKKFFVDSYSISALIKGDKIRGNVSYHFVEPRSISYAVNNRSFSAPVFNKSFEINATYEGEYLLKCGNARLNLTRKLYVENGFVNRTVKINASFIPVESYVKMGNLSYRLNFTNGSAVFVPRKVGVYTIFVDGIERNFTVDSYEIRAFLNGTTVRGSISYHFMPPSNISYLTLPSKISGVVEVINGSFSFEIPPSESAVLLECGNANAEIEKSSSYKELDGLRFEANVTYLEVIKRDDGFLVHIKSNEGFSTILKVYPVIKELVPLREDGKPINLRTRITSGVQEFLLEDGSPSDPDNASNGEFTFLLSIKKYNEIIKANRTILKEIKKPKLKELKNFTADGSKGRWYVRIYELLNGSSAELPPDLIPLKRKNTFMKEEKSGEAGIEFSYREVRGGVLVEVNNKEEGKWIRVELKLPRGGVAREVLALSENGTREVDLWYQKGDKLVFYDDPNQYYYVLYNVPSWWDPDGVCNGFDWHYRVPVQVPPLSSDHTIYFDLNFTKLLSKMNISGTFDQNSVRVVDDQGNLVPKQEFIPLEGGFGRIKFILHKDVASPTYFYIYFDIVENGQKPYLNTLNAGLDSGTLNYWIYGKNPSNIASIIGASSKGPFTVCDYLGGANPTCITDDGNPVFGSYSLVLGYRTNNTEDYTAGGENTWAYYEFRVPSDGGNIYFWYRVESWDSANYDYFRADLLDSSGNLLYTIVPNYNPNPGNQYGNYKDSGWLSASYDLSAYAGQTVRVRFLVHTSSDNLYKSWAYIDNLTWAPVDLTSSVNNSMVEGFGVNVTSPRGMQNYGPLKIEAKVDARPSSVIARIYDPSENLAAKVYLYDDGTHGDAAANDGVYTNSVDYFLAPGSPLGKWRIVVLANDSSSSTYSPSYNGLIHIPNRPYEANYTDFFNIGESEFYLGSLRGEVFEDKYPIASHGKEDSPFSGTFVYAFRDNGDNSFDPLDDALVTWGRSKTDGTYSLSVLPGLYFLPMNSRNLTPPENLNPGHSVDETWAEQTYQTEWNGSAYIGKEKLGGIDPEVSDACMLEIVFHDDFETWSGWSSYGLGGVRQSNSEFYNGSYSLEKYTGNDPNGGYKLLGRTIGRGYVLQGYAYKPPPIGARGRISVALVDSNYNGYGFIVNHRSNTINIVRRTGGAATTLASQSYNPPEETWYFWKLVLLSNNTIIFRLYDTGGNMLAQVRATDTNYNSFDRVLVQGDADYYLDTLVLWRLPYHCEHVIKVDTSKYLGESLDFGFSYEVIVNTRDSDDAPTELRFAQGSLRQFIMNSNAIAGMQKSYFMIPKTDAGYSQESSPHGTIDVWRIKLSSYLPQVTDSVNLTAKTQPGISSYIDGSYVGCDSYRIPDFLTPKIEVDGNSYVVFNLSAKYVQLEGFSVYNTPYAVVAWGNDSRYLIRDNFIGAYSNGTDTNAFIIFGVFIGKYSEVIVYRNLSAVIKHNIIAKASMYGIVVNSGNLANATVEENWIRKCGAGYNIGDGISLQTNGNLVLHNLIEKNTNNGDISRIDGGAGVETVVWRGEQSAGINRVLYNTIVSNGRWGVSVLSLYTKANITGNVISGNQIGIIVSDTSVANITRNCIYNNSRVGIDLDVSGNSNGDDVTLNDGQLNNNQPNKGVDYPVITSAILTGDSLNLQGFIDREDSTGSSVFAGAKVDIYLVRNSTKGDNLTGNNLSSGGQLPKSYGEGWLYLGSLVADSNGRFNGTLNISGKGVDCFSLITATATVNGTSEFGPDGHVMCRRNISASIEIRGSEAILKVRAHEITNYNVIAYWKKPQNISIDSMSGDYDATGTIGDVCWWRFNKINAGQTKNVTMQLSFTGDYRIIDAFNVGVDPLSDEGLKIDVKEFSSIVFYPNGSYFVRDLWGFLILNNTSPDIISDILIYLNATNYKFYLDYPNLSSELSPPLRFPFLPPGHYVRWKYTAPRDEAFVPLIFTERNISCGAIISIQALDDVNNVVIRKFNNVYRIGDMKRGEIRNITMNMSFSGCIKQNATVEFSYSNASLLNKIKGIKALGPAEIQVKKEVQGNKTRVTAYMRNTAASLVYRLDKICIMRSQSGPILLCESPARELKPNEIYETGEFSENITGIPKYYANASFTILPSVNGVTVPLQSITSGYYIAAAELVEPEICCFPPPPPSPPPSPPLPPSPPAPTVNITPAAPAVNVTLITNVTAAVRVPIIAVFKSADKYRAYVGDIVRFTMTIRNSGNGTWEGDVTDSLPDELKYTGASSAKGNVTGPYVSGGTLSWHVILSPGREAVISYQAVITSYPPSGYVENLAVAAGSRSSAYIEVVKPVGVADIRKAGELSGREITYVISVTSTNYEGDLTVLDSLPKGLSYVPGALLDGSPSEPVVQENNLIWKIYMKKNQTRTIVFKTYIDKVYGIDLVNTAGIVEMNRFYGAKVSLAGFSVQAILAAVLPFIIFLLMITRRRGGNMVIVDYITLKNLYLNGKLPDVARTYRIAVTDLTMKKLLEDRDTAAIPATIDLEVISTDRVSAAAALEVASDSIELDSLISRFTSLRMGIRFLPDIMG